MARPPASKSQKIRTGSYSLIWIGLKEYTSVENYIILHARIVAYYIYNAICDTYNAEVKYKKKNLMFSTNLCMSNFRFKITRSRSPHDNFDLMTDLAPARTMC